MKTNGNYYKMDHQRLGEINFYFIKWFKRLLHVNMGRTKTIKIIDKKSSSTKV